MAGLSRFLWTDRARPVCEIGLGDTRIGGSAAGRWNVALWDDPEARWSGIEPEWLDVSCDVFSAEFQYGRQKSSERFVVGVATVLVDNSSGWADPYSVPDYADVSMRPGRQIRVGVAHRDLGTRWLFRGFIDGVRPAYHPSSVDTVELSCIDALGEVNRARFVSGDQEVLINETADKRVERILNKAAWPFPKRDIVPTSWMVSAPDPSGQVADLLSVTADSVGGAVFGTTEGEIAFRPQDWQGIEMNRIPDYIIGNGGPADVCPVGWDRPFERAEISTRIIVGRNADTAITLNDPDAQAIYGIEVFERTDLITFYAEDLQRLAEWYMETRGVTTAPRIRSVTLDARTEDAALDLMTTVDVYQPTLYRARLIEDDGRTVFDNRVIATAVQHRMSAEGWELNLNLDLSDPYEVLGGRWDEGRWDDALWLFRRPA